MFYKQVELSKAQQKRNRREEQKRLQEKKRQQEEEEEHRKEETVNLGEDESNNFASLLSQLGLELRPVASDGHCLYRAVAQQLPLLEGSSMCEGATATSFSDLRRLVADYLRNHQDEYQPYLEEPHCDTDEGYRDYCNTVEKTSEWGGEVELRVLSHVLRRKIVVHNVDSVEYTYGDEFGGGTLNQPVRLSYHKHLMALGAHYNAVVRAGTAAVQ
eukprot:GHVS01074010.1.p1 GENE.GHVS01074010.1~~GHVS01074010.1.p1  ORF type:complete len:215 (+),score=51.13 GHVS01074010.1:275-919(+)